jgi:hypothetical protein
MADMALFFEVDDKTLSYTIEVIPTVETLTLDQGGLLREIIELSSRLKEHHDASISKYGKLIGQGRIGILEVLDLQFIDVVLLVEHLRQSYRQSFLEFQKQHQFHVVFEYRNNKYVASGIINDRDTGVPGEFNQAYATLITEKLKTVLVLQRDISAGNESAGAGLFWALDDLLYSFIILRYNIIKCSIER